MIINNNNNNSYKKNVLNKKPDVKKVWDAENKFWDYVIVDDENWKPKNLKFKTKDDLKNEDISDWFDITKLYDINKLIELKLEHENQLKDNIDNAFKLNLILKKYILLSSLVIIYYTLKINFDNKNIYYFNDNLKNLYNDKPSLQRLNNKIKIDLPEKIEKFSNINYGIITYWDFENGIIFKN